MNCPECCGLTRVYGSHVSENGGFRVRYRECLSCGHKYRSIEEIQAIKIRGKTMRKTDINTRFAIDLMAQVAILKDDNAMENLYEVLSEKLRQNWIINLQNATVNAIKHLALLKDGKLTQADIENVISAMELFVGADAMIGSVRNDVITITESLYKLGIKEVYSSIQKVKKADGVDLSFDIIDQAALELLQRANLFWIGNSWNSHTDDLFRNVLTDYFEQGFSRQQSVARFAEDFAGLGDRSVKYWDVLADHTVTKTREIGRVDGYLTAEIEYVQIRAWIDDSTTDICRDLNGKIIPVGQIVNQRDDYLTAVAERDVESAKKAWKMWSDKDYLSQPPNVIPKGTGMPPYHFRCRTITVAYFND